MKFITVIMVLLLLLLQYRLWTGNGSLIEVSLLREEIEKVKSENESLKERNNSLIQKGIIRETIRSLAVLGFAIFAI